MSETPDDRPKDEPRFPTLASFTLAWLLVCTILGGLTALVLAVIDSPEESAPSGFLAGGVRWLDEGESYIETRVMPDGDVAVTQWIHAEDPLGRIELSLPATPDADIELAASDVQILAGGGPVPGPTRLSTGQQVYYFDATTVVRVRYRLTGALERSDSASGRALATTTSLPLSYEPRTLRETRVVLAPEVLSLACTSSSDAVPVPCGQDEGDGQWHVELDGPEVSDLVMAQLTVE